MEMRSELHGNTFWAKIGIQFLIWEMTSEAEKNYEWPFVAVVPTACRLATDFSLQNQAPLTHFLSASNFGQQLLARVSNPFYLCVHTFEIVSEISFEIYSGAKLRINKALFV